MCNVNELENKSTKFDLGDFEALRNDLKVVWTKVEGDTPA